MLCMAETDCILRIIEGNEKKSVLERSTFSS